MKRCAAPDCARDARARGYCDTHYRRVRKWGDPTIVLNPWGTDTFQPNREERDRWHATIRALDGDGNE